MKRRRLWVPAALLVATLAVATYYYRSDVDADVSPVTTVEVKRGDVVATVEASGTLQAVTTVQVGTQVSGTIKTLNADFNSRVRKGQVIAELDPSLFQTQVAQEQATVQRLKSEAERARVQADDAQVKLRRARELSAQQLIARSDLDAAQSTADAAAAAVKSADSQVTQANASLSQAQVNLSHAIIRAPIDGVVIARNVDVGQTVAASMQAPTLFVIAQDLTEMRVDASIDESDIGKIQPRQAVHFRVDAYPTETFTGTISQVRLQPVVDQNVVTYVTVIDVPNKDLKLKPGMTAAVTVEIGRADDVVTVPNAALRFQPDKVVFEKLGQQAPARAAGSSTASSGGSSAASSAPRSNAGTRSGNATSADRSARRAVWVLDGGHLRRVPVQVGLSDGKVTAVTGELTPGAFVATGVTASNDAAPSTQRSPLLPTGGRRGGGGRS
ncbi:MAG TPA: efflux RND transporter periplasmic adaptor subunit [Vicinamibacterales bacterium]|nr:efflux RND transporter periplasmic adaptor subunit [Vicinamibacterales bacterium]